MNIKFKSPGNGFPAGDAAPVAPPISPAGAAPIPAHLRRPCPFCNGTGMARDYLCLPCDGWGYGDTGEAES